MPKTAPYPPTELAILLGKLRWRLIRRAMARKAVVVVAALAVGFGTVGAAVGLLAWLGMYWPVIPIGGRFDWRVFVVHMTPMLAMFWASYRWDKANPRPTIDTAALFCETVEGSPGTVPLALRGIGGPQVYASALAAVKATLARPLPPALGSTHRRTLAMAIVVVGIGLGIGFSAPRVPSDRVVTTPNQFAYLDRLDSRPTSIQNDATADAVAALREQLLQGSDEQREMAAARYAALWQQIGKDLGSATGQSGAKSTSGGRTPSSETMTSSERIEHARKALSALAEAGLPPGSTSESKVDELLRSIPTGANPTMVSAKDPAEIEAEAKAWLEQADLALRELATAATKAAETANSFVAGAGSPGPPRGGTTGLGPFDPSGTPTTTSDTRPSTTDPPTTPQPLPRPAATVTLPPPGTPTARTSASASRAATAGARYLAALESAGGAKENPGE